MKTLRTLSPNNTTLGFHDIVTIIIIIIIIIIIYLLAPVVVNMIIVKGLTVSKMLNEFY